jgi:hypothetical protein
MTVSNTDFSVQAPVASAQHKVRGAFEARAVATTQTRAEPKTVTAKHAEAARLLSKGFKLCTLHVKSKRPVGDAWQLSPVQAVEPSAGGYGMLLADNGLCSIDADNVELARAGLKRCGFELDELMNAGVRTSSTRPGSGGRSTFRAPAELGWRKFSSKVDGTILELRAGSSNLQDCLPGTVYVDKHGGGPYEQQYANGKKMDEAPELPPEFLAWWQRLGTDLKFLREQQLLFVGPEAALAVSLGAGAGKGEKLAFGSGLRRDYNAAHHVEDILAKHGYTTEGGGRWAPSTASGAPCVRLIPGCEDLWQSDHASDPLHGTFDAWTANVVLNHNGVLDAAEAEFGEARAAAIAAEFDDLTTPEALAAEAATETALAKAQRHPVSLDWGQFVQDPPEPKFLIPGWLPDGVVTLFAAHGGTGKSYMSLYIALCLATGRHPFEPGAAVERIKVLLYSAEDNMMVMQSRLARYMRQLDVEAVDLDGWLDIRDATGCDNVLFTGDEKRVEGRTTARFKWLADQVQEFGAGLLIFDNASDAMDANENDRAKVRQFVTSLTRLAPAVLLLAHVDAASSMSAHEDAKGYSGSTGWHNSARSRWFMSRVKDSDDILLTLPKVNYAKAGLEAVVRWSDSEKVFEVVCTRHGKAKAADNRAVLLGLLHNAVAMNRRTVSPAVNTRTSVYNTLKEMEGFPAGLKSQDVAREVDRWLNEGLVVVEPYKTINRKEAERLMLTNAGRALFEGGHGVEDLV